MSGTPPIPERSDSLQASVVVGLDNFRLPDIDSQSVDGSNRDYETPQFFHQSFRILKEFQQNGSLCDVTIKCGTKSTRCHRLILASVSGYFKVMFLGDLAESRQNVVSIEDIDEQVMEMILNYAYTGKIHLSTENVQSILYASLILQVDSIAQACCDFMKSHLHPDNCVQVHAFAMQHNREQLIKYTQDFITDNFLEVSQIPEFKSMSAKVIDTIISAETLNVSSEAEVYEAVIAWILHDVVNRKQFLHGLLSKLKLPLLPPNYLMEKVATNDLIRSDLSCRDLLDEAKVYHMNQAGVISDVQMTDRMKPRKSYAGVLFCVGGRGASGDPYKTIECYHPMKDRWYQVTEMFTRRRHVGVCCLDGEIYAVGGHNGQKHLSSGEVFNPSTAKWRKISSMITLKTGVRGLGLAVLGGAIYAVGGLDDKMCFDTVERFDASTNTWTQVASMNIPRGGVGVAVLKGNLYAVGGNDGTSSLNQCECYDPIINKWTNIPSMGRRRAGAGVGVLNGFIYTVGGFDDNCSLDSCEKYDVSTRKWTAVANLSCPRGGVGVASLGGKLYAVGGHDGSSYLNSVESYDPITNSWQTLRPMEETRAGAGICSVVMTMRAYKVLVENSVHKCGETNNNNY